MIARKNKGNQILIGIQKAEVDRMLEDPDKCLHLKNGKQDITIFVVDGDDEALDEEFLRIVAINVTPDPGAKPQ